MENQKTKKLSVAFIVVSIVLAVIAITFIILYGISEAKKNDYGVALENMYEKSFYEVNNIMQSLEVKVDKVVVSNNKVMQRETLNDIWRDCNLAAASLAGIPIDGHSQTETIRFLNQLGGYSVTLADKTLKADITESEFNTLSELQKHCLSLKRAFNSAALMISSKGFKIIENLKIVEGTNNFEAGFDELKNNESKPPELIYDGPFSESLSDKDIKGLPEETYTESEVTKKLWQMFEGEDIKNVTFDGYVDGDFQSYNHTVELKNGDKIFTTVAKRGMFLLQFSRLNATKPNNDEETKTDEELMTVATDFVKNLNLEDFKAIFISRGDGVAYVNVAPVMQVNNTNVVVYPDIIKIKLEEVTAKIIGYEAKSYAFNHVKRNLENPTLSASDATKLVSSRLTVNSTRLSIVPIEYGEETLCYEFECQKDGITFYIFINANTGAEEQIFRVIENSEGKNVL